LNCSGDRAMRCSCAPGDILGSRLIKRKRRARRRAPRMPRGCRPNHRLPRQSGFVS
jgi:hypothetical protein